MARKKVVSEQRRMPSASKQEVEGALFRGSLAGFLMDRRVTLSMAEEVLAEARDFLRIQDSTDDERLRPLVRYIEQQRKRVQIPVGPRLVGERCRYKVQRNNQRRTSFTHIPLSTLEVDGEPFEHIDVAFEADRIIITRAK